MATLSEVFESILSDETVKTAFSSITDGTGLAAFLQAQGCESTVEEAMTFITEKCSAAGEVADEDLAAVAGGKSATGGEAVASIFSVGLGCALMAAGSAYFGHTGTGIEGEGMLCDA